MLVTPQSVPTFTARGPYTAELHLQAALQPTPELFVRVEAQPQPDAHFDFVLPPLEDDCVALMTAGACVAVGTIGERAGRRVGPAALLPGHVSVLPRATGARFLVRGRAEGMLVFPSHRLLARVAEETLARPPQRVQLRPCVAVADPLLQELLATTVSIARRGAAADRLHLEALVQFAAVHLLCRHGDAPARPTPAPPTHPAVDRVVDYIHAHLGRDLSLAELAQVAALSPFHLARVFKRASGETLHQYVLHRRLEEAMRLLQAGGGSVTEVAHAVGFSDHSHFARRFKRRFGVSPAAVSDT